MKFQILCLATQTLLRDSDGGLVLFERGEEAAKKAKELTERDLGSKWQPRRILSNEWRKREEERFANGTYIKPPWAEEHWAIEPKDHFSHVSQKFPGKVAFTLNATDGDRDMQTAMRAGKYLKKFYGNVLTSIAISREVNRFAALYEDNQLLMATTEDDIVEVFTATHKTGANSCMSYPENHWSMAGFHPVRAYAAGDLAVAYLVVSGQIAARAMVWPERKTHSRVYGDVGRLTEMLANAGYVPQAPIEAKLLLRTNSRGYVVTPYIDKGFRQGDGQLAVRLEGDHLVVCHYGEGNYLCDHETGLTKLYHGEASEKPYEYEDESEDDEEFNEEELVGFFCPYCEETIEGVDESDATPVRTRQSTTQLWCDSCVENHAQRCADTVDNGFVRICHTISMEGGDYYWTTWHFNENGSQCSFSGDNYPVESLSLVHTRSGQKWWADCFIHENAITCAITGYIYDSNDIVELPDGRLVGFDTNEASVVTGEYHSNDPAQQEIAF